MFNKIKKYDDKKNLILAFLIPITILLFFCVSNKITYSDFFVADLQEQYSLFFYYLKDVFDGNSSIFYSYYKQLGGSMIGTYIYYLSSPWNLLLFFVSKSKISIFIVLLIFNKIGLSSMTMYLYLKSHFNKKDKMFLLFSLTYALSGFIVFYFFNIMWLDIVYLAPLVLIGLDKIINNENNIIYIIFLWLSIISNCYMAYILCVFVLIYFIYEILIQNKKDKLHLFFKFIKSSAITVFLSAFILIPFAYELLHIYRSNFSSYNSISLMLKKFMHIFNSFFITKQELKIEYWYPNLYFSIINLILLILYFFNKKINNREKKITILFLMFFIICYIVPFVNNLWHGTTPQVLNYRYSFLITIFLINLSYKSYLNIKKIDGKTLILSIIIVFLFYFISYINVKFNYNFVIIINLFFIISYFLLLKFNITYKNYLYKLSLLVITILEIIIYLKFNLVTNKSMLKPFANNDDINELCKYLNKYDSIRIDGKIYSSNESLLCKNSKILDFNTMNNGKIYNFLKSSGYTVRSSWIDNYYDNFNIINEILGVKYFYTSENLQDKYTVLENINIENSNYKLYRNNNIFSIGFTFNEHKILKNADNNFEFQNYFVEYLAGEKIFYKYNITKKHNNTFTINVDNNYPIYINYNNIYYDYIYINDKKIKLKSSYELSDKLSQDDPRQGNMYIENKYNNEKIEIKFNDDNINENDLLIYYIDMDKYKQVIDKLADEQLKNITINKTVLKGNIDIKEDKTLFISIPYDKNFTIYVDGKKTEYRELFNTFIGIDLKKGRHTIKLRYYPKYIFIGIFVSSSSLLFTLMYKKYEKTILKY